MSNIVCWLDIPVTDLDRAIGFYSALLGEAAIKQAAEGMEFGLLPHASDGVSGCLVVTKDSRPSQNGPLVYLSVEGRLDAALEAVREGGGKVMKEKHPIGPHGFRAIVVDSEGNRIALHSMTG